MKKLSSFYTEKELKELGLKHFGENVLISRKCSIYGAENISVGDHVRIDDFCILSGSIKIGNYVHIAAYCALYGKFGIEIGNFCGLSPRCTIFSASDDFSGEYMISPLVPAELTNVQGGLVILENYVQLGANSTVMTNLTCREGSATGTYSLVLKDLEAWTINIGIPCRRYKDRSKNLIKLAAKKDGLFGR